MHYLKNLYLQLTLFATQHSLPVLVFTIRQRSCGTIMFSVMPVGLFVHMGSHVTITHDALDLTTPGMFKRVQLGPHCTGKPPTPPSVHGPPALAPPLDMFKLVHYEAGMIGKWAVGILLECFLGSSLVGLDDEMRRRCQPSS